MGSALQCSAHSITTSSRWIPFLICLPIVQCPLSFSQLRFPMKIRLALQEKNLIHSFLILYFGLWKWRAFTTLWSLMWRDWGTVFAELLTSSPAVTVNFFLESYVIWFPACWLQSSFFSCQKSCFGGRLCNLLGKGWLQKERRNLQSLTILTMNLLSSRAVAASSLPWCGVNNN